MSHVRPTAHDDLRRLYKTLNTSTLRKLRHAFDRVDLETCNDPALIRTRLAIIRDILTERQESNS